MSRGKRFTVRCPWKWRFNVVGGGETVKFGLAREGVQGSQVKVFRGTVKRPTTRAFNYVDFNVSKRFPRATRETGVVRPSRVVVVFVQGRRDVSLSGQGTRRLFPGVQATVRRCDDIVDVRRY